MVEQLLNHIERHNLCKTTDKILLAVSGGVDSMVMLHLFRQAGFKVGVVHCNFQLRGEASLADENLVKQVCADQDIPFYVRRFYTSGYADERGLSIQMAARELRYSFFNTLLKEEAYDYLATAHHFNDSIETTLLNLAKGTGIDGLTGIPQKKDSIIRPLSFASKETLVDYAVRSDLIWREDESNASEDYQRNFIRHQIIPKFRELNPNFESTFQSTLQRLTGSQQFAKEHISFFRSQGVSVTDEKINIDKKKLLESPAASVLLWELIKDKGFNFDQCLEIITAHQSGKKFSSSAYELFIDRDYYIIEQKNNKTVTAITIEEHADIVEGVTHTLRFSVSDRKTFVLKKIANVAQLDHDKVKYPLMWRQWRPGDHFVPFGLKHSKKLSDFFIDMKLSMPEKNKVTVLESAGEVIWVVGLRINDRFKVTESTDQILTIRFEKNKE